MSRKRFTQIIDKTNNVIPIGGEAQNITLKDGSILEQALGKINLAKNGSIIDQINKLKTDTLAGEYAPLASPAIQRTFAVQQDYISYNPSLTTDNQTRTKDGMTMTRKSANSYEFSGTFVLDSSSTSTSSLMAISGSGANVSNIGSDGEYTYIIKTNFLKQGLFSIEFYHNSTASTSESNIEGTSIYVTEDMLEGQGSTKTAKGTFTVPSGHKLCRVALRAHSAAQGTQINDGNTGSLTIYLYKKNTFLAFKISKSSGNWDTSIRGNLTVKEYQGIEPRSSLGTIYNSSWEGVLNVKANGNSHNGILIEDSGIGFIVSGNTQTQRNRYKGVTSQTDYRIFTGYSKTTSDGIPGIYYDSFKNHNFRIKNSSGGYTNVLNLFPQEIILSNPTTMTSTVTMKGNAVAEKNLTVQGTTSLKTTTATNLTVTSRFRSGDTPIQVNVTSMSVLEGIINDSNTYPNERMLLLRLTDNVVYYLVTGNKSKNSSAAICPAMGFKENDHSIILFYAGQGKIYRTQYGWPSGQANRNNNRKWTTYSTKLETNELIGKNPVGEKFL